MVAPRYRPTVTSLRDGSVLVAGGTMVNTTETFRPSATFAATPLHFGDRRSGAGATRAWVVVRNLGSLRMRITQATLTGLPAAPAAPPRTATASCVRAPRKAGVKLRGSRCGFSLVGMTGWSTVKAELRRDGKVRAAGRVLGWRGSAGLTLAARQRLGRGAYTLMLRPAGRTPVRLRVTLP